MERWIVEEKDLLACCGSTKFAKELASQSPFSSLEDIVSAARRIWFQEVDVNGWLEAFSAHPQIGDTKSLSSASTSDTHAQWSKGEQSTALATSTRSTLEELSEWNARYKKKFGFIFLICASGRSSDGILAELKQRFSNRPIVEFEIAAQEQMKITELRLGKLFETKANLSSNADRNRIVKKAEEDRLNIVGGHITGASGASAEMTSQTPVRTRPPITTHVLDVSEGSPGSGIEVRLEIWRGSQPRPTFGGTGTDGWVLLGCSTTNHDGRSGQLLDIVDDVTPGIYRISFNTGLYYPSGFFPYVSVVFEIKESQQREHFHVPLILSPFSFTTYRGS